VSVSAGQNDPTEREDEAAAGVAERQTLFTDAVIAIAITLLALELPIPEGRTNHEWLRSAWDHHTEYFAYALGFVVIAAHWRSHHGAFRYVRGFGPRIGRLNLLWLFCQVTNPFATKIIAGDGANAVRFGFYALIQGLASLILMVIIWRLTVEGDFRLGTDPGQPRRIQLGLLGTAAGFLVSVPLFFLWHDAWWLWIAIPVVNGIVRRR
jgi:uncharacterized membrane protein